MAPNKNKGVFQPKTTAEVPTRFRCKVGGEWKPLDGFSQNQQKLIQNQIGNRRPIDAAHSGMTCREHASNSRSELRCEVCCLIKPRDQFSKNSLRKEDYTCVRCVAWTETQEPTVTPLPLETGHISAEEENTDPWQSDFVDNADFFEDDGLPRAPICGLDSLGLEDLDLYGLSGTEAGAMLSSVLAKSSAEGQSKADRASVSGQSTASIKGLPPHLAGQSQGRPSGTKSISGASEATGSSRSVVPLPPHLLNRPTQSVSTATTVREDKEKQEKSRQIPFNAWDRAGRQHQVVKDPTNSFHSSAASSKSNSKLRVHDDPNVIGEWDFTLVELPETRGGKGGWAKASECRIPQAELKKQPVLTHTSMRHIDPDIDRQRRMNYCDSDDSNY
ncbi:hypothetical protein QQX98_000527 [Neonectria punicea]|uniref:Stc1 domain-containing protein n=1 Tax=Neonectria punicea TaxID=979145 RepID=A0ABR1HTG1_9HYPO